MPSPLQLHATNRIEELTGIIDAIEDYLAANAVRMADITRLSLIIDELFNNTVSYGYPQGGCHEISLQVSIEGDRVQLVFIDDGVAFNPLEMAVPDTSASLEERSVGGLGLHLVRASARDINYRREGTRNVLTVILAQPAGSF